VVGSIAKLQHHLCFFLLAEALKTPKNALIQLKEKNVTSMTACGWSRRIVAGLSGLFCVYH
jgi:hypothetical protein